jgi:GT2 family glycosyltransferase
VPGEFLSRSLIRILAPGTYRRLVEEQGEGGSRPFVVDFIIGACMVTRKEAIAQAGVLDEDYFFFYEEIDWCRRMKSAGWLVYNVPDAEIYHLGGGSTREVSLRARAESWRSRYLYFRKSLSLGPLTMGMLTLAGCTQVAYHLTGYTLMNLATLFSIRRLRRRWSIFAYLLLWHLRGLPVAMCLPREADQR